MPDQTGLLEAWMRVFDARYSPALIPRVRIGIITDAAGGTYSVRLPGETGDRDGVPSVAAVTPRVGDGVRVELVGDPPAPVIVDRVGPKPAPQEADAAATVTTSSTTYVGLGGSTPAVSLTLVPGQAALITVYARMSVTAGGPGHQAAMSFTTLGPISTIGAVDADAAESQSNLAVPGSKTSLFVAADPGAHQFVAQYKTATGTDTATFVNRRITAVPC